MKYTKKNLALNKTPCILPVLQHVPIHASISIFLYVLHHLAVRLQTTKFFWSMYFSMKLIDSFESDYEL